MQDESTVRFRKLLREKIIETIDSIPVRDQYALVFFVYANEEFTYGDLSNLPEFFITDMCESDLADGTDPEERWNPAYLSNDEYHLIDYPDDTALRPELTDALVEWYRSTGLENIGAENEEEMYDSSYRYIGKGPVGLAELLGLITGIAAELQDDGVIEAKFGKRIPVILADYEFTWYMVNATIRANPRGEADRYVRDCIDMRFADETLLGI